MSVGTAGPHHELQMSAGTAGLQPQAPGLSGLCRTSTTGARSQPRVRQCPCQRECQNRMPERMSEYLPERMSNRMSMYIYIYYKYIAHNSDMYFQMVCQELCQNNYQGRDQSKKVTLLFLIEECACLAWSCFLLRSYLVLLSTSPSGLNGGCVQYF